MLTLNAQILSRIIFSLLLLMALVSCSKPDFQDVKGNPLFLSELTEKYLVVNYWATWCGPCRYEIPELNKLGAEHGDKINLIGVNFDHPEDPAEQLAQVEKMKIEFPVLTSEPAPLLFVDVPEVLPTTYVFEPGGTLVAKLVGPQTEASLLALMEIK